MRLVLYTLLSLCLSGFFSAYAEEIAVADEDDGSNVAVFGTGCEKLKDGEARSSVRVRASDKASFNAVRNLAQLSNVRKEFNEHDFNVLVYNLVDNSLDDLSVKTTKQDEEEICVEITGCIRQENLFYAIQNAVEAQEDIERTKDTSVKSSDPAMMIEPTVVKIIEKNPNPGLNKKGEERVKIIVDNRKKPDSTEFQNVSSESENTVLQTADKSDKKGFVYITPTEFFNNTKSEKRAEVLKKQFSQNDYFYVTDKADLADYIVRTKVLRAKVDPINSNTNRLQMVIAVELENVEDKTTSTEHQNRFVLFSSEEDEQEVAAKLMNKLFEKAGEQTINRIEQTERKKNRGPAIPKIITPAGSTMPDETKSAAPGSTDY